MCVGFSLRVPFMAPIGLLKKVKKPTHVIATIDATIRWQQFLKTLIVGSILTSLKNLSKASKVIRLLGCNCPEPN